ncbi:Uncharacterised protein [Dorea longicatena]|uniref:Uncharacterized protein n=1 Tax=Dorea longicatena TaxID=88431 RepID=A0A174N6A2_9FIRM|nr:Uncharacterised protein [Dorea longicatena]
MKHKIQKVELFVGVIVLLGGLLTYGLGVHQLLPVPRPDLVVYGTTLIGIILILMGCDIFSKPTKEMQILENDERNIAITNAWVIGWLQAVLPGLRYTVSPPDSVYPSFHWKLPLQPRRQDAPDQGILQ